MASSKRRLWFKFGRFITGLTIACFFLPFFGVSCEGLEVVTVSGADMAGGCKPGGLIAEAEEKKGRAGGDDQMGGVTLDEVPREPLAIVALALAVVVFGLSWVRSRGAMLGAAALSVACLGVLIGLYLKVGGQLQRDVDKELGKSSMGSEMMKKTEVDAGARYGLWATCIGLLGAAVLCGLALKEPEGTEHVPPAPPPA